MSKIYLMRIIADGGATKTSWVIMKGGKVIMRFTTDGFNPNYSDINVFIDMIHHDLPDIIANAVEHVHYYGTGCGNEGNRNAISAVLQHRFPQALIQVNHDLMAAAHALFGSSRGIACILGTGSHSCLYDGVQIVDNAVSLGYILGDEGSGCHIGKALLHDYFYHVMPSDLREQFETTYPMTREGFIENCYHKPQPSRYLASFAWFAGENIHHPYVRDLCSDCFDSFFNHFVLRYPSASIKKIGFVGSVAFCFQELLTEIADNKHFAIEKILKEPMEGLIAYYGGVAK